MDDLKHGTEDSRGYWKPNQLIRYPQVFIWPPQIASILKWQPGYIFPWGVAYGGLAILVWAFHDRSPEADEALKARRLAMATHRRHQKESL